MTKQGLDRNISEVINNFIYKSPPKLNNLIIKTNEGNQSQRKVFQIQRSLES
ncbi:MAG: hypothetical protein ACI86M_000376 [Saprospiraceae bacterium]|jgi:hypothetical protein